jgi:hypothetical protein
MVRILRIVRGSELEPASEPFLKMALGPSHKHLTLYCRVIPVRINRLYITPGLRVIKVLNMFQSETFRGHGRENKSFVTR